MQVELSDITKQFGSVVAVDDLSLGIEDGEFLTLVGPSGCGKTTTLRIIAGLDTPTDGEISFDDRNVTDHSPQQRNIAFVFQDYALYPHMTVQQNMSFALDDQGIPKAEIENRIQETVRSLGIVDQLEQQPNELSGGQQQRVALGRSIVRDPSIFLLDEPLSNLDAKLRMKMRAELQTLHQELETTMIYVTHDQEEAMTMSDRIAVMNEGTLQQVARPNEAYNQPANRFVAGFIGSPSMNFFDATLRDGRISADPFVLDAPIDIGDAATDVAQLGIRPEDLSLDYNPASGQIIATVDVFERIGSSNLVYLQANEHQDIIAETDASIQLDPGDTVGISVDDERIHLFNHDGDAVYNPPLYQHAHEATIQAQNDE